MSRRNPALISLLTVGALAAAAEGNPEPIVVRSWDRAPVESEALGRAQAFVQHVFSRAGVPVVWHWCSDADAAACERASGPNDVHLRIVRRNDSLAQTTGAIAGGRAMRGDAGEPAGTIEVFEDRLESLAHENVPGDLALGVVLTHELGHLFLPPGHSPLGIMKKLITESDWSEAARGALRFTPQEYTAIRERVQPARVQPRRVPLELCPPPPGLGAL